jgi:uncharacterized protein (TIGR03067 family)
MKTAAARITAVALLALTLGLVRAAEAPGDAAQKEYARFTGTWRFESVEAEGKLVPLEGFFRDFRMRLKGNTFAVDEGGGTTHGTYKVDLSKKPKQIDITFTDGPEKGKTALGIYELEGDTYTVCVALTGKARPKEFTSKTGTGYVLEVLKRVKP